jgi:hypothetical protein
MTLKRTLLVVALICFVFAAFGFSFKLNLIALGLACWMLTQVV